MAALWRVMLVSFAADLRQGVELGEEAGRSGSCPSGR